MAPTMNRTDNRQTCTSTGTRMSAEEALQEPLVLLPALQPIQSGVFQAGEGSLQDHQTLVQVKAGDMELLADHGDNPEVGFYHYLPFIKALHVDDTVDPHVFPLKDLNTMVLFAQVKLVQRPIPLEALSDRALSQAPSQRITMRKALIYAFSR